jgi:hypothetical protein
MARRWSAGKRGGWQEVMPRRGLRRQALPILPIARPHVPAWLEGRCCMCLAPGHRVIVCVDPLGALDALRTVTGHITVVMLRVLSAC